MIYYLHMISNHQWCSLFSAKDEGVTKTKQYFFLDLLSIHAYVLHPLPPLPPNSCVLEFETPTSLPIIRHSIF